MTDFPTYFVISVLLFQFCLLLSECHTYATIQCSKPKMTEGMSPKLTEKLQTILPKKEFEDLKNAFPVQNKQDLEVVVARFEIDIDTYDQVMTALEEANVLGCVKEYSTTEALGEAFAVYDEVLALRDQLKTKRKKK